MITLGASTLGIGLAIQLRDQFTAKANAISSSFNQVYGNANRVMRDNLVVARRVGVGMGIMGGLMTAGFAKGLKAASEYEYVMKTVQLTSDATTKQMQIMDSLAVSLGTNSIFKPQQVAGAMEYLIKTGFQAKDVIGGTIQAVVSLGGALDKSIEGKGGVADKLGKIMNEFGIGPAGVGRVSDMLTKTALASSADLEDIFEGLRYVSGTARDLAIPLDTVLAMQAKLANSGLGAGIGGRSLNQFLVQLSTSLSDFRTQKHEKIFEIIGLDPKSLLDSKGNLLKLVDVLPILEKRLKGMSDVNRVGALNALANARGGRAFQPLVRAGGFGKSFPELLQEIRNSSGLAQRISQERMDTLWGSFERFGDVTWNFFKTIGQIISPIFRPVLDLTTRLIQKVTQLSQSWWGKPLIILAAFSAVALTGLGGLIVAFTTIKLLSIASTFTFGNMGRSLQLAWSQGIAGALRYATVAKGAMMVNTPMGVRWRNIATGRWAAGPGGAAAAGAGSAAAKGMGFFARAVSLAGTGLTWLARIVRGAAGGAGFIVTVLGALVGFRSLLKLIIFGLGTLLNAIIFAAQSIWAVISNLLTPWNVVGDLMAAGKRFNKAQDNMMESLGMKNLTGGASFSSPKTYEGKVQGWDEWMEKMKTQSVSRPLQINLSGKKVGDITEDERRKDLISRIGTKPLN